MILPIDLISSQLFKIMTTIWLRMNIVNYLNKKYHVNQSKPKRSKNSIIFGILWYQGVLFGIFRYLYKILIYVFRSKSLEPKIQKYKSEQADLNSKYAEVQSKLNPLLVKSMQENEKMKKQFMKDRVTELEKFLK